jgi:glutamate synthase domain-containing protein 2
MPALARARRHLDRSAADGVTLIVTGGLRTAPDFVKALALGADGVAVANAAMQAIGCIGMRACNTNNCPVGIATQRDDLRKRIEISKSATRLKNYFEASVELMKLLSRACGHDQLSQFNIDDLSTHNEKIHKLTRVAWAGGENDS